MLFIVGGIAHWVMLPCLLPSLAKRLHPADVGRAQAAVATEVAPGAPRAPRQRLQYLDSIKIFLTFSVVCHHVLAVFSPLPITSTIFAVRTPDFFNTYFGSVIVKPILDVDQVYFMALFFFISGYFTPTSLDRKGLVEYLKDKFKRYGIPLLLFMFVINPLQTWIMCSLIGTEFDFWMSDNPNGLMDPKQCWFIVWLLIFSVLYAMARPHPIVLPAPQVVVLLLVGGALGLWYMLVPSMEVFAFIPNGGMHSGVSYVVAFAGGILAKQGDWLTQLAPRLTEARLFLRCLALFLMMGIFVVYANQWYTHKDEFRPYFWVCCGIFAVAFSLVLLQLTGAYFNEGGPKSRFLSEAMYTVYLTHFLFIDLAVYSYYLVLTHIFGKGIAHVPWGGKNRTLFFMYDDESQWFLGCGVIYTIIVANLLVWPVAYGIKQLPGLNQIL
jgi:hypothetical protein